MTCSWTRPAPTTRGSRTKKTLCRKRRLSQNQTLLSQSPVPPRQKSRSLSTDSWHQTTIASSAGGIQIPRQLPKGTGAVGSKQQAANSSCLGLGPIDWNQTSLSKDLVHLWLLLGKPMSVPLGAVRCWLAYTQLSLSTLPCPGFWALIGLWASPEPQDRLDKPWRMTSWIGQ